MTGRLVPGTAELEQRREACRVDMNVPVWVEGPVGCDCELVDLSVLGARFSGELPCAAGSTSEFLLLTEDHGTIPVTGEVVRVGDGQTAVRFVRLEHRAERAVTRMVTGAQCHKLQRRVSVLSWY